MEQTEIKVGYVETKSVMTKSNAPLGGYSVNPYVGCPHACRYCYASFMKRFTGHTEEWGTFMDVKEWPAIKNPKKYAGQKVIIGTVTDGYNPLEETYGKTRQILLELKDSGADILICTKSDLVLRDLDLLKEMNRNNRLTVSWSVNTLDESFKNDMDAAVSIGRRLAAMKQVYDAGIRTWCRSMTKSIIRRTAAISKRLKRRRNRSQRSTGAGSWIMKLLMREFRRDIPLL